MSDFDSSFHEKTCFFAGEYIRLKDANLNIRTHALQYGTACIGGIRGYYNENKNNLYVFRLEEHFARLHRSAKILQMKLNYSVDQLIEITLKILKENQWKQNVYLRPFLYKSALEMSPRLHDVADDFALYAIPLNDYLDTKKGLKTCISSFVRISDSQIPTKAKTTGSYINSALAKSEAQQNGFDEGIFLDMNGNIAEGSAENIFMVKNGKIITPDLSSSVLEGITRNSVMQIANDLGIEVEERKVDRSELYSSDECFFSGTGVQVAWISSIDHRSIGNGQLGPITKKVQNTFFDIVKGNNEAYSKWLTPVY